MPAQIIQAGQINPTALTVPGAYVQIQPPAQASINGAPTGVVGVVGTACWGPMNSPTTAGAQNVPQLFGPLQNRKYDLGTAIAAAIQNGATNFKVVRVTDGTDAAASIGVQTNCIIFAGKYSGTLGNSIQVTISAGSQSGSFRATIALPNYTPEIFDNITGTGAALWAAMASAINNGIAGVRGASQYIVASAAGGGSTTPVAATYALTGGADGASGVNGQTLLGSTGLPRTGMYALAGTGCAKAMLVDCDDSTTWAAQVAFAAGNGVYIVGVTPAGDTIANAASEIASAGINNPWFKLLFGDWCYWADPVNQLTRMISPQGFAVGALANMAPQNSSLNYQLLGIVGTQSTLNNQQYEPADIQALAQAGLDVIANPSPGGAYFSCQTGHNTSSNAAVQGDNYTMMTNYLAQSYAAAGGQFVGSGNLQTTSSTDPWRRNVKAAFDAFNDGLASATPPQLAAYSDVCDLTNNTPAQIALGYGQVNVAATYLAVVQYFIVNLMGGQGVQVAIGNTVPVQAAA